MYPYIFIGVGFLSLLMFLLKRDKNSSVCAVLSKTITSLIFILTAVASIFDRLENNSLENFNFYTALFFIVGLVFGLVGDITLDLKIYFKSLKSDYKNAINDSDKMMFFGMGMFAIGHIAYLSGILVKYPDTALNLLFSSLISLVLDAIIMFVSSKMLKFKYAKFFYPCAGYCFLLCNFVILSIFTICSTGFSVFNLLLLIGSIMFIVSDLVLSMTYFSKEEDYKKEGILNPESKFMISVNHITYYIAQFLVALSILFM